MHKIKPKAKERVMRCKECAIWKPERCDSVSVDYGLCPRRTHPNSQTHAKDGCGRGVQAIS